MAKSCARFQPVKPGSEEHNRRLKHLDYVRHELTKNNKSWSVQSVADRLAEIKKLVKDKTGRAMQSKATPIREAVVLIKPDTTIDDIHRLRAKYKEKFNINVFQFDVHKDEGHFKDGKWIGNYHVHMTADFTNHETGKSLKLTRQQMMELQTVTAEVLGMERGISSDKKHLNALQYKVQQLTLQVKELREEVEELNVSKAAKQRLLGVLGMSSKDKTIEAQNIEISSLKDEINRLKAEKEELQATIKAARQKGSKEAEKAVDAALVRIGNALGISDYCGGLGKMVDFIKDLRTRDKKWMNENIELKKEIKELKRSMEQEQSIGLHR